MTSAERDRRDGSWVLGPRACETSGPRKEARKASNPSGLASSSTVTLCGRAADEGGDQGELVVQVAGVLHDAGDRPAAPAREKGEPTRSRSSSAIPPVTATCPGPAG